METHIQGDRLIDVRDWKEDCELTHENSVSAEAGPVRPKYLFPKLLRFHPHHFENRTE